MATVTDYDVDQRTFVFTWQTSSSIDDVYAKLKRIQQSAGKPVPPASVILATASIWRTAGVPLKRMPRQKSVRKEENQSMLVLQVKVGDRIRIVTPEGRTIWAQFEIQHYRGLEHGRLLFTADKEVEIMRENLLKEIEEKRKFARTERSES